MAAGYALNISERHIYVPKRIEITFYICGNMCTNMPFKIYTENKYMGTLSLAIAYHQKYQQQWTTGQKLGLIGWLTYLILYAYVVYMLTV